jgi:PAS domain S-box-containing protein
MGDVITSPMLEVSPAPAACLPADPDEILSLAILTMREDRESLAAILEQLTVPIYVTDTDGVVIAFNRACIDFAGRTPIPGEDKWCVTWRLYDEKGSPLAHDCCPMAVAIQQRRPVRGVVAVAERPDGKRVLFMPYPTPIFDGEGVLIGAINLLIDVTDKRQADALRAQAQRCRRLAQSIMDQRTIDTLLLMANEYEDKAGTLSGR